MTVLLTSIPLPVRERALQPVKAFALQTSPPTPDADACRLAVDVARGDEGAFRELYDRYHKRLFRFALVLGGGDESLAQETVQSVFLTAAAKLRRAENEAHLWNWLARVTRQQLAKSWRQRQRDSALVSMAHLPEFADAHETDSVLEESLDAALLRMEPGDRELI